MNQKNFKNVIIACTATCIVSVVVTVFVLGKTNMKFDRLLRVEKMIENSYIGEYDLEKAEEDAIKALVKSTGDKYAVYYNEEESEDVFDVINGYYVGIGLEIFANTEKNSIEVMCAYEDSPAFKSGIKKGDLIASIDGIKFGSDDIANASNYMRGLKEEKPEEKEIHMVLIRDDKEIKLNLKREKINLYRVESKIHENGICYVKYSGFTGNSQKELGKLIRSLDKEKIKGIVLDIRNNPGGEFDSSIDACDLFLEKSVIMYTLDKNGKKHTYKAKEGACSIPLAVLVNGSSASAAEIFAGSLQANKRAIIVGEKTYGKGVSQSVMHINALDYSDGVLKLTTLKNYTPDGRWINESIIPDYEVVDIKETDNDECYEKAVEILLKD